VFRLALIALGVVVLLLLAVSVLPERERIIPESLIRLENTTVNLYPQADPEAVWFFAAPEVSYDPDRRETVLYRIEDGERTVNRETDFTLMSDQVTIDNNDNLRGERIFIHLVEDEWDVDMETKGDRLVLIDHGAGRFEVPRITINGEGIGNSIYEDMSINFDFTDFQSGGPGTIGYSEFETDTPTERE
jgi:hypothetical protein